MEPKSKKPQPWCSLRGGTLYIDTVTGKAAVPIGDLTAVNAIRGKPDTDQKGRDLLPHSDLQLVLQDEAGVVTRIVVRVPIEIGTKAVPVLMAKAHRARITRAPFVSELVIRVDDHGIVRFSSDNGTSGIQLSSLQWWRTSCVGKNVVLVEIFFHAARFSFRTPGTPKALDDTLAEIFRPRTKRYGL